MTPKKTHKLIQETMVEEPTQDLDVPFETIKEEKQKDGDNCNNYENQKEYQT
jgi:hypothetical protein